MADDIVKRLRDAEWESVLYELAADEIERLRAEVKRLDDGWTDCVWHLQSAHKAMGVWKPVLVAAEADRDRLREALASVVKHWREFGPEHGFDETLERAALAGGAEPKYPHADEPVMWFDRDRETRAESPAKPQATLGTARHFCLACTRAFGWLPGECTAEPASERRPTCRSCGQFVDSRGKCRIPKHNDDA